MLTFIITREYYSFDFCENAKAKGGENMVKQNRSPFDFSKLRGKIREVYGRQEEFAKAVGMSKATLSGKLTGRTDWTRQEIERSCPLLGISAGEVASYFFSF